MDIQTNESIKELVIDTLKLVQQTNIKKTKWVKNSEEVIHFIRKIMFHEYVEAFEYEMSAQGTFFDGTIFYWDPVIFVDYEDHQIVQVVCSEIFNYMQAYYLLKNLTPKQIGSIKSVSLLIMHIIGLVPKKVRFSQSIRDRLTEHYQKDHGLLDVVLVEPNIHAQKTIYDKILFTRMGVLQGGNKTYYKEW